MVNRLKSEFPSPLITTEIAHGAGVNEKGAAAVQRPCVHVVVVASSIDPKRCILVLHVLVRRVMGGPLHLRRHLGGLLRILRRRRPIVFLGTRIELRVHLQPLELWS